MIRIVAGLTVAAALALRSPAASAESPIAGIAIGAPIAAAIAVLGSPAGVESLDAGNRFAFGDTAAFVDDDGVVLAVDLRAGSARIDVDGAPMTFAIGSYSVARADAELAGVAEFAGPAERSYRLAPRRDLVLGFSSGSGRLERIAYGEPGQLARLGLLPGDAAAKAVPYRAPVLRRTTPASASAACDARCAVYRVDVDRAGEVTRVRVVIAAATPGADARIERDVRTQRYVPASLGGRPIAASVFVGLQPN